MSTHIIDQIAAVKFAKERTGYSIDYFMLATLSGDNNLIDCASGRRARHWNLWAAGQHYKCLSKACEMAADFCGGCLRMVHGRSTPEGFIKRCRECLDTAPDYDSPGTVFRLTDPAITFTAEEKANGSKYYYERLCSDRELPVQRDIHLRGKVEAFTFDFTKPREAAKFIEYLPYNSPLWHHVKVIGPGTV